MQGAGREAHTAADARECAIIFDTRAVTFAGISVKLCILKSGAGDYGAGLLMDSLLADTEAAHV